MECTALTAAAEGTVHGKGGKKQKGGKGALSAIPESSWDAKGWGRVDQALHQHWVSSSSSSSSSGRLCEYPP